jgi:hypothetical protein
VPRGRRRIDTANDRRIRKSLSGDEHDVDEPAGDTGRNHDVSGRTRRRLRLRVRCHRDRAAVTVTLADSLSASQVAGFGRYQAFFPPFMALRAFNKGRLEWLHPTRSPQSFRSPATVTRERTGRRARGGARRQCLGPASLSAADSDIAVTTVRERIGLLAAAAPGGARRP